MADWEWPAVDPPDDKQWERIKERAPVGASVEGTVIGRQPFGVFIDLGGALALMELPSLPRADGKRLEEPHDYPPVGATLRGLVAGHRENDRQVQLVSRSL